MVGRLSLDARADVFEAAKEEAQMRGQNRVGSDHLLLALLREPEGVASRVLGMDLDQGRRALEQLDANALAAVGVQASEVPPASSRFRGPIRFTDGAKSALVRSVRLAQRQGSKVITATHLTAGLLAVDAPDPVVSILRVAGVDATAAQKAVEELFPL
jgi:ATP-dependent Clp protease ATP-binding subunit ClpA